MLDSTVALATGTVLALILLYYLLKDGRSLTASGVERKAPETSAQTTRILRHAGRRIRSYARGRALLTLVQGGAITVMLALLDVPLAVTIGLVNVVGGFIPYLGAVIGGGFAGPCGPLRGWVRACAVGTRVVLVVNLVLESLLDKAG